MSAMVVFWRGRCSGDIVSEECPVTVPSVDSDSPVSGREACRRRPQPSPTQPHRQITAA